MLKLCSLYQDTKSQAPAFDRNYCVPIALAIVSGKNFNEVNDHLLAKGYRRPRRGVYPRHWLAAADELGIRLKEIHPEYVRARGVKTATTATRLDDGVYLIRVRGHLLAVAWGEVCDWTKGRRHRVEKVYHVVNSPIPNPRDEVPPLPTFEPKRRRPFFPKQNLVQTLADELGLKPTAIRRKLRAAGLSAPYDDERAARRALGLD